MSSKGIRTPQLVAKDDSCSWLRARGAPSPTPSLSPPPALPLSRPSRSSSFLRFSIQNWKSASPPGWSRMSGVCVSAPGMSPSDEL